MEIEEFIEQDIMNFLDTSLDKASTAKAAHAAVRFQSIYLTRDFEEELLAALDDGNLIHAKRVLHDLRKKFDEIPDGTEDKQQVKALLSDLYERFRDFVDQRYGDGAKEQKKPEPKEEKPEEKPEEEKPEKKLEPPPAPLPPKKEEPDEYLLATEKHLSLAEHQFNSGDLKNAVHEYRTAKWAALHLEPTVPSDLVMRFTKLFNRIKSNITEMANEEKLPSPPVPEPHDMIHPDVLDNSLLLHLEQEKQSLDNQLRDNNYEDANATYEKMRQLAQQLHDSHVAEDTAKKLIRIHEIISSMQENNKKVP
ncbi:hypothetical protein GOV11_02035 [Candidatus Woesearchaeota archaeon]|nr:hypothetical protein [Candidatus Woesearchaeota archaeon]